MNHAHRHITLSFAFLILFTLGLGVLHGWASQRWGPPTNIQQVSDALESLPETVGGWRVVDSKEATDRVQGLLRCEGFVNRYYQNEQTKQIVELYVVLGPTGPLSVHQPEICFKNVDYAQRGERSPVGFEATQGKNSLWALTFDPSPSNLDGGITRVFYGWSRGSRWESPQEARFAFAGSPYLYKLQVSCVLPLSADIEVTDPCQDFLRDLLPVLEDHLKSPG